MNNASVSSSIRKPLNAIGVAVFALVFAVACSGSQAADTSTPASTTTPTSIPTIGSSTAIASPSPATNVDTATPTPAQSVQRDNLQIARDLLRYIPDTEQARKGFWINDYELARQLFGLDKPDPSDDEAVVQYVKALQGGDGLSGRFMAPSLYLSGFVSLTEQIRARQEARKFVGFGAGDLERSVVIDVGDNALEVAWGAIDPLKSEGLILNCSDCVKLETVALSGLSYFSWGADAERDFWLRFTAPLFDQSGIGGRLAFLEGVAMRTITTAGMEDLLLTASGEHPSLVSSDDYVDLVATMLDAGVYSFYVSGETVSKADDPDEALRRLLPSSGYGLAPDQWERLREGLIEGNRFPDPFNAYVVGIGEDSDGPFASVSYIFANSDMAEANLPIVKVMVPGRISTTQTRKFDEIFESFSFEVRGRVVIARMYGDDAGWTAWRFVADGGEGWEVHE